MEERRLEDFYCIRNAYSLPYQYEWLEAHVLFFQFNSCNSPPYCNEYI